MLYTIVYKLVVQGTMDVNKDVHIKENLLEDIGKRRLNEQVLYHQTSRFDTLDLT